jgi:hypothetical protein
MRHSHEEHHPIVIREERVPAKPLTFLGLALAGAGLLVLLITLLLGVSSSDPGFARRTMFSWHFAFMVCFTMSAGAVFWVLLHAVTNSGWGVLVRRQMENLSLLVIPVAVLAIPVIVFREKIFYWITLKPGYDPLLDGKAFYLNNNMFLLRAAGYFAVLVGAAQLFRHFSVSQDKDGNPIKTLRARQWSPLFVPLFAITITFAAIDWMMSLDHHWFSTMWGVYIFAGSAWSSMALLILLCNSLRAFGYLKEVFTPEHNHIMGKLLFAFTVFWAYIAFSQYMLIYYAHIPEETWFYIFRNMTFGIDPATEQPVLMRNSWFWVSVFLVIFHFFVPFILLITQPAKQSAKRLCSVCGLVLFMHVVDIYWIIMPMEQVISAKKALKESPIPGLWQTSTGLDLHILDFIFLGGMFAVLAGALLFILPRTPLFPIRDPRLKESLQLSN